MCTVLLPLGVIPIAVNKYIKYILFSSPPLSPPHKQQHHCVLIPVAIFSFGTSYKNLISAAVSLQA